MTERRPGQGPGVRAGTGRPPAGTDRWSRIQLIALLAITLGLMIGGVLVVVLGEDFPFVPDPTPVPAAATPANLGR